MTIITMVERDGYDISGCSKENEVVYVGQWNIWSVESVRIFLS